MKKLITKIESFMHVVWCVLIFPFVYKDIVDALQEWDEEEKPH